MKEKILSIVPEAILEEKHGIWFVSVPRSSFHDLALRLRNDEDTSFDFLVCMTGMDWGETLGVMYHLRSSKYGHDLALRVETENRENPELPSVSDIWATANLNEREVFDFYGIRFINHPDMRRLFLRNDWIGYPLRKDYDADEKINPIRLESESSPDATPTLELTKEGTIEERENVIFEDDEYVVNIGPQHPATHGVLRFRVSLEGEIVKKVDVNCGYIHRGIEKMCETLTYPQTLALTDRLDYLEPSRLVYVYRRGDGAGNPGTGQIYPDDYGRTDPYRFPSSVLVHLLYGPGSPDRFLLWIPRPGKDPGHVRRNLWGPLDSELQLHRRSHGRHPSESDHKDQRFHPIPAPYAKRISWCFHR